MLARTHIRLKQSTLNETRHGKLKRTPWTICGQANMNWRLCFFLSPSHTPILKESDHGIQSSHVKNDRLHCSTHGRGGGDRIKHQADEMTQPSAGDRRGWYATQHSTRKTRGRSCFQPTPPSPPQANVSERTQRLKSHAHTHTYIQTYIM